MQEAPISGIKPSDLVSAIEGAYRVLLTLMSLLNVNRQRGLEPMSDLQTRPLSLINEAQV